MCQCETGGGACCFGRRMQMVIEEFFHRFVKGELVFLVMKSVSLVLFHHVFHIDAAFSQALHHLI